MEPQKHDEAYNVEVHGSTHAPASTSVFRAHDASFGRGMKLSLGDPQTWPKEGTRRVLECVPLGAGPHWDDLRQSPKLRGLLDMLLGDGCWDMPLNHAPEREGENFVRHWYSPVVFPEHAYGSIHYPESTAARHSDNKDSKHTSQASATRVPDDNAAFDFRAAGFRHALLCSWKDEIGMNGPLEKGHVAERWQPVNRRRFCSKGWHIDIGPGFEMEDVRTLEGDPRQGVVLLLVLSDWEPACGGTAMVPGSHEWVRNRLKEAQACGMRGMTHDHLNMWCQDHMKKLTEQKRVLIPVREPATRDTPPEGYHVIHQIAAKKGDVVICHPWVIHSGTTNMGDVPRLMCNGMVVVKREAFERVGCMVLRERRGRASVDN